jgi:dTDP-N-acetylfucosamine:lipid II N-acetylfucosaminyltransferase
MNIHIFIRENIYSQTYLSFLERNFNISENIIVFRSKGTGKYKYGKPLRNQIVYTRNNIIFLIRLWVLFRKSKRILIHQMPHGPALIVMWLLARYLSDASWIIWGGDLYVYRQAHDSLRMALYEKLRKRIIRRIKNICTLIPGEAELAKKIYDTSALYIPVSYPPSLDYISFYESMKNERKSSGITILIGNSGNPSNNHLELFEKLKNLAGPRIRILCPLSYSGNSRYIELVIKKGNELFGSAFVPLMTYIEPSEYLRLLWETDIAFMNHDRQQGIGNIFPLLYFGKKVFLRSDTTSYKYLASIGCRVYDILSDDFSDLNSLTADDEGLAANRKIIGDIMSEKNCVSMWKRILN